MIKSDEFWEFEKKAPLLIRNAKYTTQSSVVDVCARAEGWVDLSLAAAAGSDCGDCVGCKKHPDAATLRIFELDAERTFANESNKKALIKLLTAAHSVIQDYHQGLGFLASYFRLFLEHEKALQLLLSLHRHYVPGYFKAAAYNYVRDAKVFEKILSDVFPDLASKIQSNVPAEAFCSKWFVGLNIHVLPFPALADFMDAFLAKGQSFLFQFGLGLVKVCREDILAAGSVARILAILRLDTDVYPDSKAADNEPDTPGSFFADIVSTALEIDISGIDIEALRVVVCNEMEEAAERRRKRDEELDDDEEIVFSDEEEEEDSLTVRVSPQKPEQQTMDLSECKKTDM